LAERQEHGFKYQIQLSLLNEKLVLNTGYTDKWDGTEEYNLLDHYASIKCIKHRGSVDFGDIRRQCDITGDFILYVGFW